MAPIAIRLKKLCDKAVDTYPFVFDSVPYQYKTQEMCDKIVFKEPLILKYCLNGYSKTKKMSNKADDAFLPTLKFVPD